MTRTRVKPVLPNFLELFALFPPAHFQFLWHIGRVVCTPQISTIVVHGRSLRGRFGKYSKQLGLDFRRQWRKRLPISYQSSSASSRELADVLWFSSPLVASILWNTFPLHHQHPNVICGHNASLCPLCFHPLIH